MAKPLVSPNSISARRAQPTASPVATGLPQTTLPRPRCAMQRVELVGVFSEAAFVLLSVLCLGDPLGCTYGQREAREP